MPTSSDQIVESSEALALFPTFVWKYALKKSVYRPLNERILSALDTMRPHGSKLPATGVWQTEQRLHEHPAFAELVEYVRTAAAAVLEAHKVVYDSFEITGCWANIAAPGGWHKPHSHPNNFLSGVYYVRTPEGADRITFTDPRTQRQVIFPRVTELNEANAGEVSLDVEEGMIIVFPSWLVHSVGFNDNDCERVSIAFNVMFSSFAESMAHPKWPANMKLAAD